MKATHLPPGCGADLHVPLLHNPYQQAFQAARRLRFCLVCNKVGSMDENSRFTCPHCGTVHANNLTAPRVYDRFLVLAGRGGGKTLIGAHAAREEMLVPNSIGWVMGPTYKILHDSTFPTLVRLIPPDWVKKWDAEHLEITLKNGALVAFRSLEDPDRARGPHGVGWGWFDEAAQSPERAYDVFEPTLIKAGGIIIATTTVLGFDWTYDKLERRALVYKEPGYWATRYWTEENPLFASNPVMMQQIERARKNMAPEFFDQEYRAERRNATGLVYNWQWLERSYLGNDDEVRKFIPEWPAISPQRTILVGLDSGADHPFGAVMVVVTDKGLVVVRSYLKRMQAISAQATVIKQDFGLAMYPNVRWYANKNEANLRLEFSLRNINVVPVDNRHETGIQRVASWLHTNQLFFAYTAKEAWEQTRNYRYADNVKPSTGEKKKEQVFKLKDELPDAIRYAVMGWPSLPDSPVAAMSDTEQARWNAMDERTKLDIERVRTYNKQSTDNNLEESDPMYPVGEFFNSPYSPWEG